MIKALLLFVFSFAFTSTIIAQGQNGIVVIQNSGMQPLPQVSFVVAKALPTTSDQHGKFRIQVPSHTKGERLLVQEIAYKDWVVVNRRMIEQWVYTPQKEYRVDMCPKQEFTMRVEQLYELGRTHSKEDYKRVTAQLRRLQEEGEINRSEYMERYQMAQKELLRINKLLDVYVPLIAGINLDYLTPFERKAQEFVLKGDLLQAINLYESLNLEDKFKDYVRQVKAYEEELEQMIPTLERYAYTLMLRGGSENYIKAGRILKRIADSKPYHAQRNFDYALFALRQLNYDEAISYLKHTLEISKDAYMQTEIYEKMGLCYQESNHIEEALDCYSKSFDIIKTLPQDIVATGQLFISSSINLSNCLLRQAEKVNVEEQKKFAGVIIKLLERALEILDIMDSETVIPKHHEYVMMCCNNMISAYRYLKDFAKLTQIQKRMESVDWGNEDDETMFAYHMSNMNVAYMVGQREEGLNCLLTAQPIIERLYKNNPYEYVLDFISFKQYMGAYYYDLNYYNEANLYLEEGIDAFEKLSENLRNANSSLYYDLLYMLSQSYFYNKQYYEIQSVYDKIRPLMQHKSQNYDVGVLYAVLTSKVMTGDDYNIVNEFDFIEERAKEYAFDESFSTQSQACFATMGQLCAKVGKFDRAEIYYQMSDNYALQNNHYLEATYNKLNRMSILLMQQKYQMVVGNYHKIRKELIRNGSDAEGVGLADLYATLGYIGLGNWEKAEECLSKIKAEEVVSATPMVYLTKIAVLMHKNLPFEQTLQKFEISAKNYKNNGISLYLELMCDCDFLMTQYYLRCKNYNDYITTNAICNKHLEKYISVNRLGSAFVLPYFIYQSGDFFIDTKEYSRALNCYEQSAQQFKQFEREYARIDNFLYTHLFVSSTVFPEMSLMEKEFRAVHSSEEAILQKIALIALDKYEISQNEGNEFLNTLVQRNLPNTNLYYISELMTYCTSSTQIDKLQKWYPKSYSLFVKQLSCLVD